MLTGLYMDDDGEVGVIPEGGSASSVRVISATVGEALRDIAYEDFEFNTSNPKLIIPLEVL